MILPFLLLAVLATKTGGQSGVVKGARGDGETGSRSCELTLAMSMCSRQESQAYTSFGCTDAEDVLKVKYNFSRQIGQVVTLIKSIAFSTQGFNASHVSPHRNPNSRERDPCIEIIVFTNNMAGFASVEKEVRSWDERFTHFLRLKSRPALFPAGQY